MNTTTNPSALLSLAGMRYHQGKSPEHWIELVGVDPRSLEPGLVEIKRGECYWTHRAEQIVSAYFQQCRDNWRTLGVTR